MADLLLHVNGIPGSEYGRDMLCSVSTSVSVFGSQFYTPPSQEGESRGTATDNTNLRIVWYARNVRAIWLPGSLSSLDTQLALD